MADVERSVEAFPFATAAEYGDPLLASLAMLAGGVSFHGELPDGSTSLHGNLPRVEHVRALARLSANEVPFTGLGAALSFAETGRQVQVIGSPATDVPAERKPAVDYWVETLEVRRQANIEVDRVPDQEDLRSLLQDPKDPWRVLMYIHTGALHSRRTPVRPVLVVGQDDRELTIHNPGDGRSRPLPFQTVPVDAAFGRGYAASQVSLLAMRNPLAMESNMRIPAHH
jgi:hypothetical protein